MKRFMDKIWDERSSGCSRGRRGMRDDIQDRYSVGSRSGFNTFKRRKNYDRGYSILLKRDLGAKPQNCFLVLQITPALEIIVCLLGYRPVLVLIRMAVIALHNMEVMFQICTVVYDPTGICISCYYCCTYDWLSNANEIFLLRL